MSKNENNVVDTKKLVLRYKALEAQLRNSIPEKEHDEAVAELEQKIAEQEKELARTRTEFQKASAFSKQVAAVGEQVAILNKTMTAQGKTVDSIAGRISQGTVPSSVHQQVLSKVSGLEERMKGMVSRVEYSALERRFEEATQQIGSMTPSSEFNALKQRNEELENTLKQRNAELENTISSMVPKEQLVISEARVKELEGRLAEHVPQSVYEELVSKVVLLAEEATGGPPTMGRRETSVQVEPTESRPPVPAEPTPAQPQGETSSQPPSIQANVEVMAAAGGPAQSVPAGSESTPEIREVGSQLAELSTSEAKEVKPTASRAESEPILVT